MYEYTCKLEAVGGDHQESHYSSIVVRFSISDFAHSNVSTLDLAIIDPDLRGFSDGYMLFHIFAIFALYIFVSFFFSDLFAHRGTFSPPAYLQSCILLFKNNFFFLNAFKAWWWESISTWCPIKAWTVLPQISCLDTLEK
jgi:hypothetical protein